VSIVVVSNRVARPRKDVPITGGLAAALLPAIEKCGAIWVGSSGRLENSQKDSFAEIEALGAGALATVDLPAPHYRGFYEGFSNSALWPALHSRADLIRVTREDYAAYREINAFMARALIRFCRPDATYWIQDYHFLTLGHELRRLGVDRPIGFFLHTPWATRTVVTGVPNHRDLVTAMLAYDLIGFQTAEDMANFADYVREELGLPVDDNIILSPQGRTRLGAFPIGIDVDQFAARATKAATRPEVSRLRMSLQGAKLAIGVDRVDYSKGLCNRLRAFDRMLQMQPSLKRAVSLLQVAVPSRTQISSYRHLQNELATLVGEVNGRHGEVDWQPIRYINKAFGQGTLAGFYRVAQVGVVTPLRDGMNLVAKEYVAAQNPFDPGVLVLSEFAGAAKELDAAMLVNPHDIDGMARAIAAALQMTKDERIDRWTAMIAKLRARSIHNWFAEFVTALQGSHRPFRRLSAPVMPALTGTGAPLIRH
jgi:trehalose 6-phosphate synthase